MLFDPHALDPHPMQEFPKLLGLLPRSAPKPNGLLPHRTEFTMHGADAVPGPPLLHHSMSAPPLQLPGSCCDGADRHGSTMATSSSTGGGGSGGGSGGGRNNRDGRIGTTTSNGGRGGAGSDGGGDRRPTTTSSGRGGGGGGGCDGGGDGGTSSSGGRGGAGGCDGGGGRMHPQLRRSADERMLAGSSSGSRAAVGTGFGAEATSPGNKGCKGSLSGRHAASPWLPTTCEEDEGHAGLGAQAREGAQHVLVGR